jgi:hypothetical protein
MEVVDALHIALEIAVGILLMVVLARRDRTAEQDHFLMHPT